MSYQNLKYTNIAGEITATYNDNNMRRNESVATPAGPGLLMTATGKQGLENQPFRANASAAAIQRLAREFGSDSDVTRMLAAAQQVANETVPVSVMRIGAKPFHFIIEKATVGLHEQESWITITPYATREEDTAAELQSTINQLSVLLQPFREGSLIRQRVVIYNNATANPVYDSEGLIADRIAESLFDVDINVPAGMFLWTPSAFDSNTLNSVTLDAIYDLADIRGAYLTATSLRLSGDSLNSGTATPDGWKTEINIVDEFELTNMSLSAYNAANVGSEFGFMPIAGSAGDFISNCERYAANEIAYEELEFENISFLHCDRCYADTQPVDIDAVGLDLKKQLSWQNHNLGYMWKYTFDGRPNVFMSARKDPFDKDIVRGQYVYDGITYDMTETQQLLGDALNLVEFHLHPGASGTPIEVESFFTSKGLVECHVDFDADMPAKVDGSGLTEAEFETYADAGYVAALDQYDRTLAEWQGLAVWQDDGNGVDAVTGLNQNDHEAYAPAALGVNYTGVFVAVTDAKGRTNAEYSAYIAAGHQASIIVETPFAKLTFGTQKFDHGNDEYVLRLRPSLANGSAQLSTFLLDSELNSSREFPLDPFFMNHFQLTGNLIPEAVMSRIFTFVDPIYENDVITTNGGVSLVAANVEVREVSFLHQAASAAYLASTNYSQTIAIVPTTPPPRSRNGISAWAGNPAEYQIQTNGDVLVTSNGTGVLGTKLLAGATSYRGAAAFGGIILTNGALLPNEVPYGIDDTDEALDGMGNPIDLGKHAIVVGAYGLLNDPKFSYAGNRKGLRLENQSPYLGSAAPMIAGILATQPPGTEPIGPIRGRLQGFNAQQRTPRAILNNLAALRICMIDQTGIISSIYTAALRTSDYTKVSSILAANGILGRLRQECLSVIGSAYTDAEISSLAQRLDGVSRTLVAQGYAQQLSVQLKGSRLDRINGVIRMSVRFIPPLSIEAVEIDLTLEPPASGI